MNSVVLIGRLARDPELSYTPNTQTAITRFTLAVDRPRRQGEDQGADFIRITVFGRQAETCDRYLSKGRQAAVLGRIQTGSYKNREGVTVYTTEVIADRVEFLGGGQGAPRTTFAGGMDSPSMPQAMAMESSPAEDTQSTAFSTPQSDFGGFDDMPDSFQAAEDDIPF
ncbi:MAG: single-stranded DNA-binding protein [Mogibacterium sp.]|nr:single-stranded DNA-binding protein [Mogibacterium sp.]